MHSYLWKFLFLKMCAVAIVLLSNGGAFATVETNETNLSSPLRWRSHPLPQLDLSSENLRGRSVTIAVPEGGDQQARTLSDGVVFTPRGSMITPRGGRIKPQDVIYRFIEEYRRDNPTYSEEGLIQMAEARYKTLKDHSPREVVSSNSPRPPRDPSSPRSPREEGRSDEGAKKSSPRRAAEKLLTYLMRKNKKAADAAAVVQSDTGTSLKDSVEERSDESV